jgi:hypothetical protein
MRKNLEKLLPKTLVSTPVISIIGLMATGCNDKKSDDSLDIFRDEKSAENLYINKIKATKK